MKKIFAIIAIILLVVFVSACNVSAQYATKGDIELGGAISYSSTTAVSNGNTASESTSLFQFQPYASYFIFNGFSVALSPGIGILSPAGATESTKLYGIFLVPGYTFNMKSNIFPYVQGLVGYTALKSGATDNSGLSFGGKGGVKLVAGKNGLVSIGVSYMLINLSPSGASSRTGFNNFAISFGYSIFLDN
ncbi:MAG TPA: hypothetical protein VKA26_10605 [Ignavibacteriaceae bacterium]|nr:hypothetical protein [Ignavibacteriaceae bacterium]